MLSSCVTSFETGQEAATLPKNDLGIGAELGSMKAAVNARYGILNKLDFGTACNFRFNDLSGKASSVSISGDFKWQFFGEPVNHFVLATGAGFGTGIERTTSISRYIFHITLRVRMAKISFHSIVIHT